MESVHIKRYDTTIELVQGKANIPSYQLVVRPVSLHHFLVLQCSVAQRTLIHRFHTYLYAHWGMERTAAVMTQQAPLKMNGTNWPRLRHNVRQFAQSCPKCQKMDTRQKTILVSRIVLSILKSMERISIDTIGPLLSDMGLKYIFVIIAHYSSSCSLNKRLQQ
jgi:hypothetical protein